MKIATKIFLCTVLVLTVGFNIGSSIFVKSNFDHSMKLYMNVAISEYYTQKYMLESEIITHISQGATINDRYIKNLSEEMVEKNLWENKFTQLWINDVLIFSTAQELNTTLLQNKNDDIIYSVIPFKDSQLFMLSSIIKIDDKIITFKQGTNITPLFIERDRQLSSMAFISIIIVVISSIILFFLSKFLTRNIKNLALATKNMADGNYNNEIPVIGNDEVASLTMDFNLMTIAIDDSIKKLDDYAKSRDAFVTNFSHELKTPMTSIIGYADVLRRNKWTDDVSMEAVSYIFSEGKRLEKLSQKMLQLMEIKQRDIPLISHNLPLILNNAITSSSHSINKKNCNIHIICDDSIKVKCDEQLLHSLFINLIENAVKASYDNGNIYISATKINNDVDISITDCGKGIAKEHIGNITDTFYMVDRARKGNNTGIGLSICKEIATLHKTQLTFKSQLENGTTVSFQLQGGDYDN